MDEQVGKFPRGDCECQRVMTDTQRGKDDREAIQTRIPTASMG